MSLSSYLGTISYPDPSSFLLRMLDENEGLWKGPILRRSWLVLWNVIQYNKSAICELLEPVLSRAPSFSSSMRSKKLEGSGYEINLGSFYARWCGDGLSEWGDTRIYLLEILYMDRNILIRKPLTERHTSDFLVNLRGWSHLKRKQKTIS